MIFCHFINNLFQKVRGAFTREGGHLLQTIPYIICFLLCCSCSLIDRGVPIGGCRGCDTPHSSVLSAKFAAVGKFKGRGKMKKGKKGKKEKRKKREKEKKERKTKERKREERKRKRKEKEKREKEKKKLEKKERKRKERMREDRKKGYVTGKLK